MGATPDKAERFELRNPQRWVKYVVPLFLVGFVVWIPLTWFHGSITSRSTGSAVSFFAVMLGWAAFMCVVYLRLTKAMNDPARNFVEVRDEKLVVVLPGMRRTALAYRDITKIDEASARGRSGNVIVTLRSIDIARLFSGFGGLREVRLDLVEPDRFLTAVAPHLA